ncbi:MAG: redoxin domain-containing protein [Phycisphaerae bacterium]|nr:redoxin domain-containing protein [Phycisphaerae bacterium]
MKNVIFITVSLLALVVVGCKKQPVEDTEPQKEATGQKQKAPAFELKSFEGNDISLSDYKNNIVVLEWFNYECPFCRYHFEDANTMTDLAAKFPNKGVVWLAVNSTAHATAEKNLEYAEKYTITYPILDDRSGVVGKKYGARTTPHIFIIDEDGFLAYQGAIDNAPLGKTPEGQEYINYANKALEELTAGKPVSEPQTKPYGCSVKYAD